MGEYRYLVVGGGMTGDAACRGIREHDPDGAIGLFAAEPHPPYARPPLTKGLWAGKDESTIWRGTPQLGVDVHAGRAIVAIDDAARTATDAEGAVHGYEKILLATGGTPRRLPSGDSGVVYFRTVDDFRRLRALAGSSAHVAVLGSGFIGSEIAAALASNGCRVTMVFATPAIGSSLFPPPLAAFVSEYYQGKGVDLLPSESVDLVLQDAAGFTVKTQSGREVSADAVVAGFGIVPNTDLAESIGLEVEDGIVVDVYGRASGREDVFAAGDVARFPVPALGGTRRIEHEDHANTHGRMVGANMAGANTPYDHLPFFYSDLFDLGYEAVGDVDSRLETVESWSQPNRKGVIAYVGEDGAARGFLLWDVWGKVDTARELIREGARVERDALRPLLG